MNMQASSLVQTESVERARLPLTTRDVLVALLYLLRLIFAQISDRALGRASASMDDVSTMESSKGAKQYPALPSQYGSVQG